MNETTRKGRIFGIQRFSLHDGDGIRTTVFFKGCNLRCIWCHNPESQTSRPELLFYRDKCTKCGKCKDFCKKAFTDDCTGCGACASVCPTHARVLCGAEMSAAEVLKTVLRDKDYYVTSGGGVTLSGGEPLLQTDFAAELLALCRREGINTAVETAGNVPFGRFERIIPYTDVFLYDIKCIDDEKHIAFTGASNKLILENAVKLVEMKRNVLFRMPVIPGYNDDEVGAVSKFVGDGRLELMPYHNMCVSKYSALGREFVTENAELPTASFIKKLTDKYGNTFSR